VHAYVKEISKFFGVTWLHAVVWLTDDEIDQLEFEIGWRRP